MKKAASRRANGRRGDGVRQRVRRGDGLGSEARRRGDNATAASLHAIKQTRPRGQRRVDDDSGIATPSRRHGYGDNIASMAWKAKKGDAATERVPLEERISGIQHQRVGR